MTPSASEAAAYRVLVVDDDPSLLAYTAAVLRAQALEVTSCLSPLDALERLACERFHLLCADFQMPHMNGAELLRRAGVLQPHLHRILLTATPEAVQDAERAASGALCVLGKPVPARLLVGLVRRLARGGTHPLASGQPDSPPRRPPP